MVDDMKKQMRRFEHIISYKGNLDATSRNSMKDLIDALTSKYKKDLMTLSKIYYVLEHPRSVGLTWKRRITKKKKIDKFGDMDLIEWRELEELFEVFDPTRQSYRSKTAGAMESHGTRKPPSDRPFRFQDEFMEDWTESYSEDSEYSGAEDFEEEIKDIPDDVEHKLGEFQVMRKKSVDEKEDISKVLSKYHEFSPYRCPVFKQMDDAKTFMEWYELYSKRFAAPMTQETKDNGKLSAIVEDDEIEAEEVELEKSSMDEIALKSAIIDVDEGAVDESPIEKQQTHEELEKSEVSDQEIRKVSEVLERILQDVSEHGKDDSRNEVQEEEKAVVKQEMDFKTPDMNEISTSKKTSTEDEVRVGEGRPDEEQEIPVEAGIDDVTDQEARRRITNEQLDDNLTLLGEDDAKTEVHEEPSVDVDSKIEDGSDAVEIATDVQADESAEARPLPDASVAESEAKKESSTENAE